MEFGRSFQPAWTKPTAANFQKLFLEITLRYAGKVKWFVQCQAINQTADAPKAGHFSCTKNGTRVQDFNPSPPRRALTTLEPTSCGHHCCFYGDCLSSISRRKILTNPPILSHPQGINPPTTHHFPLHKCNPQSHSLTLSAQPAWLTSCLGLAERGFGSRKLKEFNL